MKKKYTTRLIFIIGTLEVLVVSLLHEDPVVVFLLVALLSLGLLKLVNFEARYVQLFLLGSVLGFFAEATPVAFNAWTYTTPHFLQLPIWLPLLWGSVAIVFVGLYEKYLT